MMPPMPEHAKAGDEHLRRQQAEAEEMSPTPAQFVGSEPRAKKASTRAIAPKMPVRCRAAQRSQPRSPGRRG